MHRLRDTRAQGCFQSLDSVEAAILGTARIDDSVGVGDEEIPCSQVCGIPAQQIRDLQFAP